jgi:PAS domain S-box-containing protein
MNARASGGVPAAETLTERYQTLSLLHRMSLELFSEKPFADALSDACRVALALTGARSAAIYFQDPLGRPSLAERRGDGEFADPRPEEDALAVEALSSRRSVLLSGEAHWAAVPFLRPTPAGDAPNGVAVFGGTKPLGRTPSGERVLAEIARVLHDARLIQSVLQQRKVFVEVFDQSADAIVIGDLEGRVVEWNRRAEELFGWGADEIVGRPASVLWGAEDEEDARAMLDAVLRGGRHPASEASRRRKDGSTVSVEVSAAPLADESGAIFGTIRTYRDITARKEVERMRADFVAMVIHDLRTPLTAVRGFAETLSEYGEELPADERRRYLAILLEESKRMASLVSEFLTAARVESATLRPARAELELRPLLEETARLFEGHAAKPVLRVAVSPGAERLNADPSLLRRLLVNLAGNAVKYSPPGGTVTLAAAPDGDAVLLSVADAGPGVPPAELDRLFEKFHRADDAVSRRTTGTGLGLAVVKGIAEAHGGRAWAENRPEGGAVFKVRLPRRPAD